MSIKDFEDKSLKGRLKDEDLNQLESGQNSNRPDKKLLMGTVQFYEDVLLSLHKSLIAVFNNVGKHIEVWGNSNLKDLYGIIPDDIKGKILEDVFPETNALELKKQINEVFESGKSRLFRINLQFPNGNFWLEVSLSPLLGNKNKVTAVVGYFRDITEAINLEKELTTTKEKYRNLIELSTEGIVTANLKGFILSVNLTFLGMSGYEESDFIGKKITRMPVLQPKDVPLFQATLDTILIDRIPGTFEFEWKNKNGTINWSETFTSPIKKNNKISGFQIIFNDITERKLIENNLLKSKQAYKIIIENATEAISILQDGNILFCNSRLLELVNCSMDELQRTPFSNFIHPFDNKKTEEKISDLYSGKAKPNRYSFRLIDKDGNFKWIENNSVLIEWNNKPAILSFATDITDNKLIQEKEKKQVSNLKLLSEKAMEFIELKSEYNVFQFIGEKIREIIGDSIILLVSYDYYTSITNVEHIESSEELRKKLLKIIDNTPGQFNLKLNHELIKNLSFGKLIKYNDGLFELGYNLFPKNTFTLIQDLLRIGDIYLIGLTWENTVYGNAMIFLPDNKKIENPEAIEMVAKFGSFALQKEKAENALRESEEKFRRIFESYQDVYFKADIDGTIIEISPSVQKIGGYRPEEIEGNLISDFFTDKSLIKLSSNLLIRNGSISDQDLQLLGKDGRIIDSSLNARLLKDEKGNPIGYEGVIRDISERKKVEEDFRKSEEKFRTLADHTFDWEYWVAPNGSLVYMSPSCEKISGYKAEEFAKDTKLLLRIIHPDDHKFFKDHLKEEKENKNAIELIFKIITKDNEVRWINHICQMVYGEDGRYLGRRVTNRDITDQKFAEEELRNSEERFKTLFFESPDAIIVEDYEGNILDVNPAACKLHKMERDEMQGINVLDLVPTSHRDRVARDFPKWISGELVNHRGFSKTSEGECIPVDIHASKIQYSGKDALFFIIRDITKIKESEDKLKNAIRKAEEADTLKSMFLANMSHEIRTPMNAIIGFSEILSDQDLTKKERQEFINYITQGSNTLMDLIEDIIDITKIEAGQIKINFAGCDVNELMDELYATFLKMKNKNGKQGIELRLNKPHIGEDFAITTDPSRIRQILSNLIGNALKFTEEGYIEFGFNLIDQNRIVFYVKDTGIGIPKDKQDLIFERFGQIEDSAGREKKGTGLGLSISQKLADLLGGSLKVESEEGAGTTFFLNLPINRDYSKETVKEKPPSQQSVDWSDKLFLIAEDSILNYTYLEALFQKTNAKLLWAKDGKEAIEMCKDNKNIDLVLMDIKMPIIGGLEAIARIKKFRKNLPIIVQTAYAMPEDRDKSFEAGGDEHLTKPINADELFTTINKFLN